MNDLAVSARVLDITKQAHEVLFLERLDIICEQNPAFEMIEAGNLAIGMYVSELDCPWLETPFLMQGFLIESESELSQLRIHCKTVLIDRRRCVGEHYADTRRKHSFKVTQQPEETNAASFPENGDFLAVARYIHGRKGSLKPPRRKRVAGKETSLEEDLLATAPVIDDVHRTLKSIDEAKEAIDGNNFTKVEELVGEMASGVERNPDAMLWLTRLRVTDQYSYDHAVDVSVHAMIFGRFLGFDKSEIELLGQAGLLQDVGKIGIDPEILSKPSALTEEEYLHVQSHVACSLELLERQPLFSPEVLKIVAAHHERIDGSGYPRRIRDELIGLNCEISGMMDTYCAMTRDRVFSPAISSQKALEALYKMRGTKFRATLVDQFIQCLGLYPIGTLVELNTGEVGIVIQQNQVRRLRPRVLILMAQDKTIERRPRNLDLMLYPPSPTGEPYRIMEALPSNAYGLNPAEFFLD